MAIQDQEQRLINQTEDLSRTKQRTEPWIIGWLETGVGLVPRVTTELTFRDVLGSWKARWNINRMDYKVPPGLYAIGNPDAQSLVLVSANYKMSFDRLRRELTGLNLWIVVLETKGVNVWCAAGKGSFGTTELVERIAAVNLTGVITHRTIILPQLAAPGVAAHEVAKLIGFKVVYGPVRAKDIPAFLETGFIADSAMREIRFDLCDRLILTPIELVGAFKPLIGLFAVLFLFNLIQNRQAIVLTTTIVQTIMDFLPYLGAVISGAILVPVLLPYLPGRALALKGWLLGLVWAGVYSWRAGTWFDWSQVLEQLLILPAITSFLAMNFTGATTYTSLSGVKLEMKWALPAQITAAGIGLLVMVVAIFIKF